MKKLILLALILFMPVPASAWMSMENYQTIMDIGTEEDLHLMRTFVSGLGQGFLYANTELISKGQPQLYCQPKRLALTEDNFLRILDDAIENSEKLEGSLKDMPIGILLLKGLEGTFPCNKK